MKEKEVFTEEFIKQFLEDRREDALRDYRSDMRAWREEGRAEGLEEARKEARQKDMMVIAKRMLDKNMDRALIAELTGLSMEQIEELAKGE